MNIKEAIEYLTRGKGKFDYSECASHNGMDAMDKIVEAVRKEEILPVVHCEDCANRGKPLLCPFARYENYPYEGYPVGIHDYTQDNDYCSHGRKKK